MRVAALSVMLMLMLAGCASDEGEDPGTDPSGEGDGGTGAEDQGNQTDEEFEPYTETWDGSTRNAACVAPTSGGTCAEDPSSEPDSFMQYPIEEGASLASFEFTWDEGGEIEVTVNGNPTVDPVTEAGTSPLSFEVELDDTGDLGVNVEHTAAGENDVFVDSTVEFHMEMTVS